MPLFYVVELSCHTKKPYPEVGCFSDYGRQPLKYFTSPSVEIFQPLKQYCKPCPAKHRGQVYKHCCTSTVNKGFTSNYSQICYHLYNVSKPIFG